MNYQLRACHEMLEKIDAAIDAQAWGYPRKIGIDEVRLSAWFRMGESVVFWMHRVPDEPEGDLFPHLAVSPNARGHWPWRKLHRDLLTLGEVHGGCRLRFPSGEGTDDVEAALRRLGWTPIEGGLVLPIGGGDVE